MIEYLKHFWLALVMPALMIGTYQTAKNWEKIMNITKQKYTFCEALEALKNGATIYRADRQWRYTKISTKVEGKVKIRYGNYFKGEEDKISTGICMNIEDMLADDWCIDYPDATLNEEK